jgi:hypothetical protein
MISGNHVTAEAGESLAEVVAAELTVRRGQDNVESPKPTEKRLFLAGAQAEIDKAAKALKGTVLARTHDGAEVNFGV